MTPISELLADHQLYHSTLQMDALITVRAGGTLFGCYKQSLRELSKRDRGLKELTSQRELLRIDLDELESMVGGTTFDERRRQVKLASLRNGLDDIERNISETDRELQRFHQQADSLRAVIGEVTPERRAVLDADMWAFRVKGMAAIDYLTTGMIRENTATFLQALPGLMREPLCREVFSADGAQKLIDWFLNYSPDIPELPVPDAKRIAQDG